VVEVAGRWRRIFLDDGIPGRVLAFFVSAEKSNSSDQSSGKKRAALSDVTRKPKEERGVDDAGRWLGGGLKVLIRQRNCSLGATKEEKKGRSCGTFQNATRRRKSFRLVSFLMKGRKGKKKAWGESNRGGKKCFPETRLGAFFYLGGEIATYVLAEGEGGGFGKATSLYIFQWKKSDPRKPKR